MYITRQSGDVVTISFKVGREHPWYFDMKTNEKGLKAICKLLKRPYFKYI